jgi:hypothetical protein
MLWQQDGPIEGAIPGSLEPAANDPAAGSFAAIACAAA